MLPLGGKNWLGHGQEDVCRPVVWECGGLQVWLVQKREAASHNCLYDIALSSLGSKCCCCHSCLSWNPNITIWWSRHPQLSTLQHSFLFLLASLVNCRLEIRMSQTKPFPAWWQNTHFPIVLFFCFFAIFLLFRFISFSVRSHTDSPPSTPWQLADFLSSQSTQFQTDQPPS